MLLGRYKTVITPALPCALAGFAHRTEAATEKYGELYLRTTMLKSGNKTLCFLVADLIWWDDELVKNLRKQISKRKNIPESHLHFTATHTHSGPQVSNRFSEQLGRNETYVQQLIEKACDSVKQCKENLEPVQMFVCKTNMELGMYRRKRIDGKVEMAPDPAVEVNDEVTVVSFVNEKNREIATWIHYACHPTTTDANIVSGEFPGVCAAELKSEKEGCVVSFFQGFSGDVRPKLISNNNFYRGSLGDMIAAGKALAQRIAEVKKQPCPPEMKVQLCVAEALLPLEYTNIPDELDIPLSLYEEWKQKKEQHDVEQLCFSYIRISENLAMLLANAEMTQGYGKFMKNSDRRLLPVGYSNGMLGYIATKEQLEQGGYEAETFIFYFSLKGKLDASMEEKIQKTTGLMSSCQDIRTTFGISWLKTICMHPLSPTATICRKTC